MRLLNEPQLSFADIAQEWSREVAGTPGALGRDEILFEMVRALWRGDFEDDPDYGEPTSCLIRVQPEVVRVDGVFLDKHGQRTDTPPVHAWNRRRLLAVMPPVAGVRMPSKSKIWPEDGPEALPWKEIKPQIPFEALRALNLSEYDDAYREAYLEELTISKEDFRLWCDLHGHECPTFWFGEASTNKKEARPADAAPTRQRGEPKPETIEGWKKDYDAVSYWMQQLNCGPTRGAKKEALSSDRSAHAIERGYRRYKRHVEKTAKRQNGKNPRQ